MKNLLPCLVLSCVAVCGFWDVAHAQQFDGPGVYSVDSLLDAYPIGKDEAMRSDEIGWDSLSSVHLIQIRDGVAMHHHAYHDVNVMIIRGAGRLILGTKKSKVKAGDIIHIPYGTPHSFHSLGSSPAVPPSSEAR